ncbi:hypothetical protein ATCV1_z566R [Acanthocystis turfacea chlorella virus 1]|uniref:Uncharacterized protein z566R n=1 Tax=Chlorovirus heliozoae TaxID=322019 RepID=A7K9H6_9PHYC|nr:hypothetical protein ATCV1_z566R [Acanthocystis turfacea chlorella virus 1]ABT16700.1 hypothetical protein ATCV1_z566R [Acanthocystis turfacea chlorella virus 1]
MCHRKVNSRFYHVKEHRLSHELWAKQQGMGLARNLNIIGHVNCTCQEHIRPRRNYKRSCDFERLGLDGHGTGTCGTRDRAHVFQNQYVCICK